MKYMSYFLLALTLTSTPLLAMNYESDESEESGEIQFTDDDFIEAIAESCTDSEILFYAISALNQDIYAKMLQQPAIDLVTKGLQKAGKSICEIVDKDRWTTLHWAAGKGDIFAVNLLLMLPEAKQLVLTVEDDHGDIPLHLATYFQRSDVMKALLQIQVDQVYVKNTDGDTAWDQATWWMDPDIFPSKEIQDILWPFLSPQHQKEINAEQEKYLEGYAVRTVGCLIQ